MLNSDTSDIKTSLEKTELISRQLWHALSRERESTCKEEKRNR